MSLWSSVCIVMMSLCFVVEQWEAKQQSKREVKKGVEVKGQYCVTGTL